jgi:Dyp-type peroxidase family
MPEGKSSSPRPMNVFVRPGSKAEFICRSYAAGEEVPPRRLQPITEAIAAGFPKHPELNLRDRGGKIIQDLVYTNFFVGGDAWNRQDIQRIDTNLAKAMSDPHLNNVLIQYFRGAAQITSTFRPSTVLPGPGPDRMSQNQVEALLTDLHAQGKLANFDLGNTVFNFLLPPGTVLATDDGGGDERSKPGKKASKGKGKNLPERAGEVEEAADSLHGLGGFHGSVRTGASKLYYAVGVFSDGDNGIVAFDQPWKNVVATFYHELVEARTDADVAENRVAWVNNERPSEEIGDIPMTLAGANLGLVMKEVPLADGSGTVPIQLMWSNAVGGPEGPIPVPHPRLQGSILNGPNGAQAEVLSPKACPIREASAAKAISVDSDDPAHHAVFDEPVLNVGNIQGSVLTGFNKSHRILLFLKVDTHKISGFKEWLKSQIPFFATSDEVIAFTRLFKATRARRGREGTVKSTWTNIAFSFAMLKHLNGEADQFADEAFRQGLANRSADLGDPTEGRYSSGNWLVGGPDNEADVMLMIEADDRADMLDEFSRIQESIDGLQSPAGGLVDTGIRILFKDEGANLPAPLTGHEHFGFLDGVSQPGLRGLLPHDKNDVLTLRQNPNKRDQPNEEGKIATAQGKPGQDLLYPGEFVFGYPRQNPKDDGRFDGPNADPGHNSLEGLPADDGDRGPAGPKWAQDGSFLVYRRLRQDVGAFHRFLHDLAEKYKVADPDNASAARLVGSRLVGRWPSGAPVMRVPDDENPALADDDCKNNNFEFQDKTDEIPGPAQHPSDCVDDDPRIPQSQGDPDGARCPFSGHIRKAYPRDDHAKDEGNPKKPRTDPNFNESTTQTHRLLRRGLPYGPVSRSTPDAPMDDDIDRGLQFLAYQTSIHNQFEFVIRNWVNAIDFKETLADGGGHDPVIGQNSGDGRIRSFTLSFPDPDKPGSTKKVTVTTEEFFKKTGKTDWVLPTAGGYFFTPSISALRHHLT